MQEHLKYKHIKSLNMVNMVKSQVKRNFLKKGLVTKHGEVDLSKIMATVKCNISHMDSK